jgi:hypothetical protein
MRRLRITSRNAEYFLLQEWCSVKEMASSCSLGGGSSHIQVHESKVYFTEGDVLLAMFG